MEYETCHPGGTWPWVEPQLGGAAVSVSPWRPPAEAPRRVVAQLAADHLVERHQTDSARTDWGSGQLAAQGHMGWEAVADYRVGAQLALPTAAG